jgi:Flp pilus assembly protein TadD
MNKTEVQETINRARSAYKARNYAKAQDRLELLLQAQPDNAEAHYLLALCYFQRRKPSSL